MLIRELTSIGEAVSVAERLREAMKAPFDLDGNRVVVTSSIGIAALDSSAATPDEVLRNADVAMYQAKLSGKDQLAVFDAAMHASVVRRLELESALRNAIERHELQLVYQPIYSVATTSLIGFEALMRWRSPHIRRHRANGVHPDRRANYIDVRAWVSGLWKRLVGSWICGELSYQKLPTFASASTYPRSNSHVWSSCLASSGFWQSIPGWGRHLMSR